MNKEETRNKILQNYWDCIPDDPNNAVTYEALEALWEMDSAECEELCKSSERGTTATPLYSYGQAPERVFIKQTARKTFCGTAASASTKQAQF